MSPLVFLFKRCRLTQLFYLSSKSRLTSIKQINHCAFRSACVPEVTIQQGDQELENFIAKYINAVSVKWNIFKFTWSMANGVYGLYLWKPQDLLLATWRVIIKITSIESEMSLLFFSTLPHCTAFFLSKRTSKADTEEMQLQDETTNCVSQRQTYAPASMLSQEVLTR